MKMKNDFSEGNKKRPTKRKLVYVRSLSEVPDFKSDDEIADWYQTHSTVLIQDQLEALPAKVGGRLRQRAASRARARDNTRKRPHTARSA
jgi:hypothetical protein